MEKKVIRVGSVGVGAIWGGVHEPGIALLADYSAHVLFRNVKMIDDGTVFLGLIECNGNLFRLFNKTLRDDFQ